MTYKSAVDLSGSAFPTFAAPAVDLAVLFRFPVLLRRHVIHLHVVEIGGGEDQAEGEHARHLRGK